MITEEFDLAPGAQWGYVAPVDDGDDPLEEREVVLPQQTHTANIGLLTENDRIFPETDALVTRLKGVAIGIRTADCVPILMYAPGIEAVAAVHAGWKGTIAGIASKTFRKLVDMGADPEGIIVRIGPHICKTCYEIDEDLAERFREAGFGGSLIRGDWYDSLTRSRFNPQKPHLDLGLANFSLLVGEGMAVANFMQHPACTRHTSVCPDNGKEAFLPSWRRNPGETKRIVSWIRLNP